MGIFDRLRHKQTTSDDQSAASASTDESQASAKGGSRLSADRSAAGGKAAVEPVLGGIKADATSGNEHSYRWLWRPHVSEKAAHLTEHNAYVFDVPVAAEKIAVKQAVEALYKVKVTKVRTLRGPGKMVRRGRKSGRRRNWKKAIVTLKAGQKIELYEGV